MQSASVCGSDHTVHFSLAWYGSVKGCRPDVGAEDDGEMLLVVHVVLIQVQEHLGAFDGGDSRAHDALDLGKCVEQFWAGFIAGVDGDGEGFSIQGGGTGSRCRGRSEGRAEKSSRRRVGSVMVEVIMRDGSAWGEGPWGIDGRGMGWKTGHWQWYWHWRCGCRVEQSTCFWDGL